MPNGKSLKQLKKEYKKKGFTNVHNLSDFVNIPAELEKARKAELRSLGVTPLNNGTPSPTRKNNTKKVKRELPNWEKTFLNKRLLAGIESNYNNIPFEFENLKPNGRNRSSTATSDPGSRSTSPVSQGGRRTRKQKRKSRKHTRKH